MSSHKSIKQGRPLRKNDHEVTGGEEVRESLGVAFGAAVIVTGQTKHRLEKNSLQSIKCQTEQA